MHVNLRVLYKNGKSSTFQLSDWEDAVTQVANVVAKKDIITFETFGGTLVTINAEDITEITINPFDSDNLSNLSGMKRETIIGLVGKYSEYVQSVIGNNTHQVDNSKMDSGWGDAYKPIDGTIKQYFHVLQSGPVSFEDFINQRLYEFKKKKEWMSGNPTSKSAKSEPTESSISPDEVNDILEVLSTDQKLRVSFWLHFDGYVQMTIQGKKPLSYTVDLKYFALHDIKRVIDMIKDNKPVFGPYRIAHTTDYVTINVCSFNIRTIKPDYVVLPGPRIDTNTTTDQVLCFEITVPADTKSELILTNFRVLVAKGSELDALTKMIDRIIPIPESP